MKAFQTVWQKSRMKKSMVTGVMPAFFALAMVALMLALPAHADNSWIIEDKAKIDMIVSHVPGLRAGLAKAGMRVTSVMFAEGNVDLIPSHGNAKRVFMFTFFSDTWPSPATSRRCDMVSRMFMIDKLDGEWRAVDGTANFLMHGKCAIPPEYDR
jgi:hypothetical protein